MPFARATGIGSTAACADHSKSVCRRHSSTICSPVMVSEVLVIGTRCYPNRVCLTTGQVDPVGSGGLDFAPCPPPSTFASLKLIGILLLRDNRPASGAMVAIRPPCRVTGLAHPQVIANGILNCAQLW